MKLKILFLEDDHRQRTPTREALEAGLDAEVETKRTEWEFVRDFEAIASSRPHVVVIDAMLQWGNAPGMEKPSDEITRNPQKAGVRCVQKLRDDPRTAGLPVVVYSIFPRQDLLGMGLPANTATVSKEPEFENLLEKIREIAIQAPAT